MSTPAESLIVQTLGISTSSFAMSAAPAAPPTGFPIVRLSPSDLSTRCYNAGMRISSGKVVDGRVELDGGLPEGASVTVLAMEGDETFEAHAESEQFLLQAIDQCNRGKTTAMTQLLAELRNRE